MRFKQWTPEELAAWAKSLLSSSLMNPHNKILLFGEIRVENYEPKNGEKDHEFIWGTDNA